MSNREECRAIYQALIGNARMINGELIIKGFQEEDYEALFVEIVNTIADDIKGNYEFFYTTWARKYYTKFLRDRNTQYAYCPQFEKSLDMQSIKEQLVTLKHFLYRRFYSRYQNNE